MSESHAVCHRSGRGREQHTLRRSSGQARGAAGRTRYGVGSSRDARGVGSPIAVAGAGDAAGGAAPQAAEAARIGVVNEITGFQAEAGQLTVNGIKLALEEINKAGGVLGRPREHRIVVNNHGGKIVLVVHVDSPPR